MVRMTCKKVAREPKSFGRMKHSVGLRAEPVCYDENAKVHAVFPDHSQDIDVSAACCFRAHNDECSSVSSNQ